MRGSTSAWQSLLATPERISDDTLYFIYESANDTEGSLYLGQKLISSTNTGSSVININDIGDIVIGTEPLADQQILVYNQTTQQWENTSLATIINTAVGEFQGATDLTNGIAGLVPRPLIGDENKFLKGNGTWATIDIPQFDDHTFETLSIDNSPVISLLGYDSAKNGSIPIKTAAGIQWSSITPGQLTRQITTLEKLQNQLDGLDDDPIDTNAIYMVISDNPTSTDRYSEYMIINNKIELLGTIGSVDLSDYVQKIEFNTTVSTLDRLTDRVAILENSNFITQQEIGYLNNLVLSENNTTLVEEINTINDRLKWGSLDDEE